MLLDGSVGAAGGRSDHGPVPVSRLQHPAAGTCKHRSQSASASTSFFVVPADVSRAQPTPVTMKRGDYLPTRVLDGAPGRQQLGGVGDKTRIIGPPEVLALSPERGAIPGSLRRFLSGPNTTPAAVNEYPAALPWPRLG